jgi:small-conductance mechanosensitive channel
MKRHLGLAAVAAAALAVGVALAQPPGPQAAVAQEPSALDRLADLEKQVGQLQAQVEALRKAQARGGPVAGEPGQGQEQLQAQMEQVLDYLAAQAESAKRLEQALQTSREKGFTYGINPDSRVVLLEGFDQFTSSLQTDVPEAGKQQAPQEQPARR